MDFGNKISQLGVFDFRAFLNVGMLLTDSEKARQLRSALMRSVLRGNQGNTEKRNHGWSRIRMTDGLCSNHLQVSL